MKESEREYSCDGCIYETCTCEEYPCTKCKHNSESDVDMYATKEMDVVNHPRHYNRPGGIECLEEMAMGLGIEAVMYFSLCNVWKYRYRPLDKGGEQDMAKSDYYMREYAILREVFDNGGNYRDYQEKRRLARSAE